MVYNVVQVSPTTPCPHKKKIISMYDYKYDYYYLVLTLSVFEIQWFHWCCHKQKFTGKNEKAKYFHEIITTQQSNAQKNIWQVKLKNSLKVPFKSSTKKKLPKKFVHSSMSLPLSPCISVPLFFFFNQTTVPGYICLFLYIFPSFFLTILLLIYCYF